MARPIEVAPPSDDKRWRIINATMRRYGYKPHALIETLHAVQEAFGFLDDASLSFVAQRLNVPMSKAYGVATFYHFFSLKPPARHNCVICLGTACYIKGSDQMLKSLGEAYGIEEGEITPDSEFALLSARCVGGCGQAPVAVVDGEVVSGLTPDNVVAMVREKINHAS
ncbi:MAG: NAD(P)H-dependent oxidoreductase subunit E [Anaerolineae bacterium]|nr:NAD(P)H-dependent oxidoreductase subunit E [Anaerolineae bacterium]MCA9891862.1 NAD(P)H-dependent oxidoreductase subunit E [Anaerolineae bacterium]